MKITKIELQKNNHERYSIYVDEEFYVGIHEEVLIQMGLYQGQTVTQAQLDQLTHHEKEHKVIDKALNYLSYGLRSVSEMRQYLMQQSFELEHIEATIERTIEKLIQMNYLNDEEYAKSYVRTAANLNRKGPRKIQQELKQRGISESHIMTGLDEYPMTQQLENAFDLAEKYCRSKTKYPPAMLKNKLYQYLLQKGYAREVIKEAIDQVEFSSNPEEQYDRLNREGERLLRRHQRKYTGYELQHRVSSGLYSKGYDYDLIQQWLLDKEEAFEEQR